ncbi:uncharacterized protein N7469_009745 [Penicillium citrinum]|uniref:Cyanovirin-N domain-containing protein n=1 Tax=Penicillium citrinum TaxID=5077 RepID=A0A9W9NJE6_PENCI|nr:uncharacterized protein N7469_009745 [Penicillium citrinum]KAJ5220858.1 hypothetical protein N7469_009745 [Penicillium citrinum]
MNATSNLHIEKWGDDTYLVGCLGDNRGRFEWGGHEFTERARNISFDPEEGASRAPILRAELEDDAGRFLPGDVNLAERINNRDGYLQFKW